MNIRPLSQELMKKAKEELNEDPKRIVDDIKTIRDWISKQPHLKVPTDDQSLVTFLRGCKYSLERTKKKIDLNYSLRSLAPEVFGIKYNSEKFRQILAMGSILLLPKNNDVEAQRIFLVRFGTYDPEKYHITEIFAAANVILRMELYFDDDIVISGVQYVGDFSGLTAAHILQFTPAVLKKLLSLCIETTPVRVKGIHLQNSPSSIETLITLVKSLLSPKYRERIHVSKKMEFFDKLAYKDTIPKELGGSSLSYNDIIDYWKKKINERTSWLDEDLTHGSDESKRPGKPMTAEEYFGVEGSFRHLDID